MNVLKLRVWLRTATQVVLAALLVIAGSSGLNAQTTKGGLVGTVVDATGAVVRNATVTINILGNPGVGQIASTLPNAAQREFQFALRLAF